MKSDYTITNDWDKDLLSLIEEEPSLGKIKHWAIRIQIVYTEKPKTAKGKPVIAAIERVPDLYREIALLDYIITIHKPSLPGLNREQLRIAIFEQLLKINIEETSDGTEVRELLLKGYDYEGFKEILDRFGSNWDEPYSRQMTMDDYWGKETQDAE